MYQNQSERHLPVFCIDRTAKARYDLVRILIEINNQRFVKCLPKRAKIAPHYHIRVLQCPDLRPPKANKVKPSPQKKSKK